MRCHLSVQIFSPPYSILPGSNDYSISIAIGLNFTAALTSTPGSNLDELANRPIYWHYPHYGNQGGTPGSSIRLKNYKLIEFYEDNHFELYDLAEDPGEKINLAGDDPHRVKELSQILSEWRVSLKAKIPVRFKEN